MAYVWNPFNPVSPPGGTVIDGIHIPGGRWLAHGTTAQVVLSRIRVETGEGIQRWYTVKTLMPGTPTEEALGTEYEPVFRKWERKYSTRRIL